MKKSRKLVDYLDSDTGPQPDTKEPDAKEPDAKEPDANKDTNPKDKLATNRAPLWLLSPVAKLHWAMAHFAGAVKYGAWNWRTAGVRASVYLSAAHRHLDAWANGEDLDSTDGTHHLGNVMACCAILLDADVEGKLIDDRAKLSYDAQATVRQLRRQYKQQCSFLLGRAHAKASK